MSIRVLHILEAGRYSGPNRTILNICKGLKSYIDFSVIYSSDSSERFTIELEQEGIHGEALDLVRLRFSFKIFCIYVWSFRREIKALTKSIRELSPDIIHVHTYLDFKGLLVGKKLNIPVIWHLHLDDCPIFFKPVFRLFKRIHRGKYVCVSDRTERNFLSPKEKQRSVVIQSSVDSEYFGRSNENTGPRESPVLVCIANYHRRKNLIRLLHWAKYCQTHNIDYKFVLLGGTFGANKLYYERLKEYVRENALVNIELLDSEEFTVKEVLLMGDIFVLPSFAEASPFVAWEAASMGLPLLCSNVGDLKKYLNEYESGIIFDLPVSNASLQNITEEVRSNYGLYSRKAKEMVAQEFSITIVCEQWKTLYDSI